MNAFDEGAHAERDGKPISANPYSRTSQHDKYQDWADGWHTHRNVEQLYQDMTTKGNQ